MCVVCVCCVCVCGAGVCVSDDSEHSCERWHAGNGYIYGIYQMSYCMSVNMYMVRLA
jgi:hypothetical protein